eukprot:TRINITY_DN136_c1_g1_i2.p1 TRINITY_DN136_c1_g1~~TRINITY_DN136_c1_g1_i2.p1  ORF type:complete len:993 (+),score=265.80 TRINITY_DN136_c1_g1_i2:345-3323(+)
MAEAAPRWLDLSYVAVVNSIPPPIDPPANNTYIELNDSWDGGITLTLAVNVIALLGSVVIFLFLRRWRGSVRPRVSLQSSSNYISNTQQEDQKRRREQAKSQHRLNSDNPFLLSDKDSAVEYNELVDNDIGDVGSEGGNTPPPNAGIDILGENGAGSPADSFFDSYQNSSKSGAGHESFMSAGMKKRFKFSSANLSLLDSSAPDDFDNAESRRTSHVIRSLATSSSDFRKDGGHSVRSGRSNLRNNPVGEGDDEDDAASERWDGGAVVDDDEDATASLLGGGDDPSIQINAGGGGDEPASPAILLDNWSDEVDRTSLFGWFPDILRMPNDQIMRRCGHDAALYLRFQKVIILFFFVSSVLGLLVILPINLLGGEQGIEGFARSTAVHVSRDSPWLWVHVIFTTLVSLMAYWIVYWYARESRKGFTPHLSASQYTAQITNFPRHIFDERLLKDFFTELFDHEVSQVFIVRNLNELTELREKLHNEEETLDHYCNLMEQQGVGSERPTARPAWWRVWEDKEDAISMFETRVHETQSSIEQLLKVPPEGTGIAFVTFIAVSAARSCIQEFKDYQRSRSRQLFGSAPPSASSIQLTEMAKHEKWESLQVPNWSVAKPPSPSDIRWTSLNIDQIEFAFRLIGLNLPVLLLLFFFSTPLAMVNQLEEISHEVPFLDGLFDNLKGMSQLTENFATVYLPTLLLLLLSVTIPIILRILTRFEGHHTKSKLERSVMRKVFGFLVVSILLMPSIYQVSVNAILDLITSVQEGEEQVLQTLGQVTPNGAFYISFVINGAFFGACVQFLRVPEFIKHKWMMRHAITPKEKLDAQDNEHFLFGYEYSYLMFIICTTIFYSTLVPIILPFAFIYFVFHHYADKYNLVYVHTPYESDRRIVKTMVRFFTISVGLYQLAVFSFMAFVKQAPYQASVSFLLLLFTSGVASFMFFYYFPKLEKSLNTNRLVPEDFAILEREGLNPREMFRDAYLHPALRGDEHLLVSSIT